MSLSQRVQRARHQDETTTPDDPGRTADPGRALIPTRPQAPRNPAREEMLKGIRVRLVDEIIGAFDPKLDVKNPADVRAKIEGIVDRVIAVHGVRRDPRRAACAWSTS